MNAAEPQKPYMLNYVNERDNAGPALSRVHPVAGPGIIPNVRIATPPDIDSIQSVVQNWEIDSKCFQPDNEWKPGEKLYLLCEGMRTVSGSGVRNKMFEQKRANRNNAA